MSDKRTLHKLAAAATQRIKEKEYWLNKLSGKWEKSHFPYDYHKKNGGGHRLETVAFDLGDDLSSALSQLSKDSALRLYIVLLAGLNGLLHRYIHMLIDIDAADQEEAFADDLSDIVVGGSILKQDTERDFINTLLALRTSVNSHGTFRELILKTRETLMEAIKHLNYPIEILAKQINLSFSPEDDFPLFDIALLVEDIHDRKDFDLVNINMIFSFFRCESSIQGRLEYNPLLYRKTTVEQIVSHFKHLLREAVSNLDIHPSAVDIMSKEEREQLLLYFNDTAVEYPRDKTIHDLFEEQAEKTPEKVAAVGDWQLAVGRKEKISITYGVLNEKADRLAYLLREKGVLADNIIGIMMKRSVELIAGILGILKAGGAYLPIDPGYPQERIDYMLKESGAKLLVTTNNLEAPGFPLLPAAGHRQPAASLAYVIYTSGSTGRPKGVMVEHTNVINLVLGLGRNIYSQYPAGLKVALVSPYVFDASVKQIFGVLLLGHALVIVPESIRTHGRLLPVFYRRHGIDISDGVPATLRLMVENGNEYLKELRIRHFIIGGESLSPRLVEDFLKLFDPASIPKITNVYGPTECCVDSTYHEISGEDVGKGDSYIVPIGKPMPNEQIYIVDKKGQLQPLGTAGEILIAGDGVGRGYLNRPELTAEKFVCYRSYRSYRTYIPAKKTYKTGDLGRWLWDGNIEFLGRLDHQVQIRGFRIEPGEIESRLSNHKKVKESVIVTRESSEGDKYLCAYIVPYHYHADALQGLEPELRDYLSAGLPDYMVPAYFVFLEQIPLTPNGKTDRKALPEPGIISDRGYVPPATDRERIMVDLWSEVLGLDRLKIGVNDNFFRLGGHSLRAAHLVGRIYKAFSVEVPIAQIFATPTVRDICHVIDTTTGSPYESTAIKPVEDREYYSLSSAQKRLYILQQMDEQGTAYNMPAVYTLEGAIDRDRLTNTFLRLIKRHESLRTSFHKIEEEAVQRIQEDVEFEIDYYSAAEETGKNSFIRAFDLSKAPLLRVGLIKSGERKHILMIDMHHIVSDGISMGVLAKEFMLLYSGEYLPPLYLQYKDYSAWQNSERQNEKIKKQQYYWQEQFSGEIPALNLPFDFVRPRIQHFEGKSLFFDTGKKETAVLKQAGLEEGATMYMVLLAIYNIFLAKITGQEDIIIGTPIAGRGDSELEKIIGMFVNTLVLRNYPVGDLSFKQFLKEVKNGTLGAFDNQDYQFEDLVETAAPERDVSRNPLFDVMFVLQGLEFGETSAGTFDLTIKPYDFESNIAKFDLTLQAFESHEQLHFSFEYCTKLFKETTIKRFIDYFKAVISSVAASREIKLHEIDILPRQEKQQLLLHFNDTEARYPAEKTIVDLFEEQVNKAAHRIALVYEDRQVDYSELNDRANRLAGVLLEKGVKPDSIIGIMIERSIEMTAGILGILKAGGAYLPVDPDYPQERIDYMLKDSGAKLLVTPNNLEAPGFPLLPATGNRQPATSLAYVIYTSGSTGRPKGVMIEHASVVNFVYSMYHDYEDNFGPGDNCLSLTNICFDVSVCELFLPLSFGSTVVLLPVEKIYDINELARVLVEEAITFTYIPPGLLAEAARALKTYGPGVALNKLLVGVEPIKDRVLEEYAVLNPSMCILNGYGPTEATICATTYRYHSHPSEGNNVPIGSPLANTRILLLDKANCIVPIGAAGELCIAGDGLGRGYLNNPELTAEKFVYYRSYRSYRTYIPSKKTYKTGDLARWLPDGNIEFLGRMDYQVKIRGYRIELGEIESCLLMHDKVKDAVVLAKKDSQGDRYLCAYCVPADGKVAAGELRGHLSLALPDYMVPSCFVFLDKIPLTPNGKVDRRALPEPEIEVGQTYAAPRDELEKKLAAIWAKVLGRQEHESIGIDDNFFESGGHSLKATVLISKIHKTLNVKVPLAELFMTPTIRGLAGYIKRSAVDIHASIEPLEKREYYRLSSAQKRLYFLQQMEPASIAYNMPLVAPLGRDIENDKLESALKRLIARHESLRTSFMVLGDENEPVQRIHDGVDFEIEYLAAENAKDNKEIIRNFIRPFDLAQAPLIRSGLIRLPDNRHIWMADIHHIVSDGTSTVILHDDFTALYAGEVLPEVIIQYKDFSEWQNRLFESGAIKSQEDYWLTLYADIKKLPRLNLVGDYKRPNVFTFAGNHYMFMLETDDAVKFKALGTQHGATLYMNTLAALNTLFYKYTGQGDIIIGGGIAGRPHADLQDIVGMFINMLAVRNYPAGEKTYQTFLKEVIDHSIRAFDNQDVQFEELVDRLDPERDPSRNPLFDISMVVQNFREAGVKGYNSRSGEIFGQVDERLLDVEYTNKTSKFDMTFFLYEKEEDILIDIEYYTAVFREETIQRLAAHFKRVIGEVIKAPSLQLKDIDIISEEEKKQILYEFNDTAAAYPVDKAIHELFEEQTAKTPDRIALVGGVQVSYKELNEAANQLANYLFLEKHTRSDARVGILMDRSIHLILAVLGILKAGGAYVPIDPSLPEARIAYMINDAAIGVVISGKKFIRALNRLQWQCRSFHSYLCIDSFDIHGEEEVEKNELMDKELWHHVGETANDDITGGGWISSYTGKPLSGEEMDEYGGNILEKLAPLLHKKMRVLEIGTASGISMFRIAPRVGRYYGTDLSGVIIEKNKKRVKHEGHRNITLLTLAAHEIERIEEKDFDLIIMNSVIQSFHGHNYLRKVIHQCIGLLAEKGHLFIGDIMDQEKKSALVRELVEFKYAHRDKQYALKTKTDFSAELFVSGGFWEDLAVELAEIEGVEFSDKIYTIENELTRFRYDALLTINKKKAPVERKNKRRQKQKNQDDRRNLLMFGREKLYTDANISSNNLAYIIYTSGTTGNPKGVMIRHRSVVNLVLAQKSFFRVDERERVLQFSSLSFDASVEQIWLALSSGAGLVTVDKETLLDNDAFERYIIDNSVTHLHAVPSFLNNLEISNKSRLKRVIAGGDTCPKSLANEWYRDCKFYNEYGPTETTVTSIEFPVEEIKENSPSLWVSIGGPVDNTRVYILDTHHNICPVGVVGELYIGGDGLARGYLNNPELTAEKFGYYRSYRTYRTYIPSKKTYKTGDLARWLPDGNIEFIGRIDYQVKIRGYRIELGEIETRLLAHNDIKEAVVIDRGKEKGDSYLCAYIVLADPVPDRLDTAQPADYLAEKLPDYMVPAYFVPLEEIPLTPSGKVDRKALPDPVKPAAGEYIAPRNRVEEKLVETWSGILGIDRLSISIDSDFFHLGGHSLNATRLIARVNKEFNLKLPLVKVFEFSRLQDFADYLSRNLSETVAPGRAGEEIEPVEEKEYYDVSPSQQRLWVLSQQEQASLTFNMPSAYSVEGQLDIPVFEKTFEVLTARHESLRTVFITINGQPEQEIIPREAAAFQIHYIDWQGEQPGPSKQMHVQHLIDSELRTPFDLSTGPLLRVKLLTLDSCRYVLLFTMHHIISDAISMNVLYRDIFLLYNSIKKGSGNPLKPLKIQYKDYTAWQNNRLKEEQLEKLKTYWFGQLSAPLPTLRLPTDHPRPKVLTANGAEFYFPVDEPLTRQLKALGKQHDATLFMVLLTAFKALLFRYTGQTDIVVGTVIAGREHADLYDQIGFFLNTLALRTRFNPEDSFAILLKKARNVCLEAYEHQLYPFDRLVGQLGIRRDASRNPVFDVMVDMINIDTGTSYDNPQAASNANPAAETGLIIQPLGSGEVKSKYDLTVYIFEGTGTLNLKFEYNRDLFENPTIRLMAERFQALLKNIVKAPYVNISDWQLDDVPVFSPIEPISPGKETEVNLPASYHQERLWFIDRFEAGNIYPANPVYHNVPLLLAIDGPLDSELLEQSIREVVRRHQALRTRIITKDNRPFQSIRPTGDFRLKTEDAVQEQEPGAPWLETALKLAVEETQHPFPLDRDREPLIRGLLIRNKAGSKFLLAITVHHIIVDRYSLEILAREILGHYQALLKSDSSSLPADSPLQYGDFSQWQRAFSHRQRESLLFYWKWKLRGKLQALELPTDRPRAPIHIYRSGRHPFTFSETLSDKTRAFLRSNDQPVFLAVFKTLLYHYSGQEEIIVGTGMKNREQPGTEGIIGPVANLVVLRSFLDEWTTFDALLSQLKKTMAEAEKYQAIPFDYLVLELKPHVDMSRTALFDVLFQYEENPFQLPQLDNLKINVIESNLGWGKYDLNMLIRRNGDRFSGVMVYNRDYYNESTISRFTGHFMVLLEETLAEPHRPISQFNLLTEEEQRQLLEEWNRMQIDYPTDKTIHQLFEEQVDRIPNGAAVIGAAPHGRPDTVVQHLTYKELNQKANRLAYRLKEEGVLADDIVGMLMERSVEMIIGMLGILKAGAGYLPIDPEYPEERKQYMLRDSGARILLTNLSEGRPIDLPASSPANLAYIIYTSGTTGHPKGCMLTHKNVISLLKNKIQPFDFNNRDVWTMFHRYNFDFSVWEMYGALLYGGKLIVIPKMVTRDLRQYLEILKQENVTVLNQTPSAFYHLSDSELSLPDRRLNLRYIIFGGEALNPARLAQWQAKYPDTGLINMFGITETTIHVTYKEISDKEIAAGASNIGRPLSTLTVYVMDRNLNLLPVGVPGELCVAGEGLARGYLNRPELTAEKFLWGYYRSYRSYRTYISSKKIYKSGDLVKLLENGDLEYLGRIDHQVKIRGFRIELGEIENRLLGHPAIDDAVVLCLEGERSEKTLCACIVSHAKPDAAGLRDHLSRRLPDYMVPALFKQVDHIPLTPNGKVDREALVSLGIRLGPGRTVEHVAPITPTEVRIAGIWREVLKRSDDELEISVHDNFFDIGGTSLDVVQVIAKVAAEFEKQIPIVNMYKYTTIRDFSEFMEHGETDEQDIYSEENRADRIQKGRADRNKRRDLRKRGRE